ncbi:MAG: PilZ domain-containing protein [Candidatus Omnitrophota bacterium]
MSYGGPEKRKHPRAVGRFIVSYRIMNEDDSIDISQTKNICMGGMLLTTNKEFNSGVNLALEIRLPFDPHPIMIIGRVLESREIMKDMIYDTRIEFLAVDERRKKVIDETVGYYIKKKKEENEKD